MSAPQTQGERFEAMWPTPGQQMTNAELEASLLADGFTIDEPGLERYGKAYRAALEVSLDRLFLGLPVREPGVELKQYEERAARGALQIYLYGENFLVRRR